MKRLTLKDIQTHFKFDGHTTVQNELEHMFILLLSTEDGQQLLRDILSNPKIKKPIRISEGNVFKGFGGATAPQDSLIILKEIISKQPTSNQEEEYFNFLDHTNTLSHELFHIKTAADYQKHLFIPIQWNIYNYLVDEARTYAYENCVIRNAITEIQPDIQSEIPNRNELIFQRMTATGRYAQSVRKYIDSYLEGYCHSKHGYYTVKNHFAVQKFQKEMTALLGIGTPVHLQNCSWYIPSNQGGYYLCGQNRFVEFNQNGRPIYSCEKTPEGHYRSTILSEASIPFTSTCPSKWIINKYSKSHPELSIMVECPRNIRRFTLPRPIIESERIKFVRDLNQHRNFNDKIFDPSLKLDTELTLPEVIQWRERLASKTKSQTPIKTLLKRKSKCL